LLSDEDCKVVGLNVSGDNPNIIFISANELAAFSKSQSDCKKKTIHLVVPATTSHPYFEIERHQQEWPPDSRGEKSERIT